MGIAKFAEFIPPRYVPFVLRDRVIPVWYDNQKGQYAVLCPQCQDVISYRSFDALYREIVWGDRRCYQGGRARITFKKDPGLIGMFLGFWRRTGNFPESHTRMEAVPQSQLNFWGKEFRSALNSPQMKGTALALRREPEAPGSRRGKPAPVLKQAPRSRARWMIRLGSRR